MKKIDLYNDGYLLETYEDIRRVVTQGLDTEKSPLLLFESDEKVVKVNQGLDFFIVSEDFVFSDDVFSDDIEKYTKEKEVYLNVSYGNDNIFFGLKIYNYEVKDNVISFIDYENNQIKNIVLISEESKKLLHISLIEEK